jgi:hypothetical protein
MNEPLGRFLDMAPDELRAEVRKIFVAARGRIVGSPRSRSVPKKVEITTA